MHEVEVNMKTKGINEEKCKLQIHAEGYSPSLLPLAQEPNAGQNRLIIEISRLHTLTHHSR